MQDPGIFCACWPHQMDTFSALIAYYEGKPLIIDGLSSERPATRNIDIFFGQRLNKRLSKRSRRRWFQTPSRPLLRHFNSVINKNITVVEMLLLSISQRFRQIVCALVWFVIVCQWSIRFVSFKVTVSAWPCDCPSIIAAIPSNISYPNLDCKHLIVYVNKKREYLKA